MSRAPVCFPMRLSACLWLAVGAMLASSVIHAAPAPLPQRVQPLAAARR